MRPERRPRMHSARAGGAVGLLGVRALATGLTGLLLLALSSGCATMGLRSAVSMKVTRSEETPKDALVYIDGQYLAKLGTIVKRGVRVPEGEHRVSIERNGYFPFDAIIVSNREPILLDVEMLELPD